MARTPVPPLILPRGLIFLSSLWLIVSWLLAIGLRAPVQPSSASYTPAIREMLLCVTIGLMIGWPLLRLSQTCPPYPIRQTLLDLVVLLGLLQVVVWPLRLVTNWTPLRTAAIDATITGWHLLAGALVAAAVTTPRRGPRILVMIACVLWAAVAKYMVEPIFWPESIAIVAFAISWLAKGEALSPIVKLMDRRGPS